MDTDEFWTWVQEKAKLRPGEVVYNGRFRPLTLTALSRMIGFNKCLFVHQRRRGSYPTWIQAQRLARILDIDIGEIEKRARLRPDRFPQGGHEQIQTCLNCPLPDCEQGERGCPLMRF